MNELNLQTADKDQLKYYAANLEPPLTLSRAMSEDTMRARIAQHEAEHSDGPPPERIDGSALEGKSNFRYVTINIAKQDKPGGSEPVFVGVQGVGYTIPRAKNIDVPSPVVEVLKNARQDMVTQNEEGEIEHAEVLTYPFMVIADPAVNQPNKQGEAA